MTEVGEFVNNFIRTPAETTVDGLLLELVKTKENKLKFKAGAG